MKICMCNQPDCDICSGLDKITHKFSVSITSTEDGLNFVEQSIRSLLKKLAEENDIEWHEV